jgi:hypothetical protein
MTRSMLQIGDRDSLGAPAVGSKRGAPAGRAGGLKRRHTRTTAAKVSYAGEDEEAEHGLMCQCCGIYWSTGCRYGL